MINPAQMFEAIRNMTLRRRRIFKHAPKCPSCGTKQVQIIGYQPFAEWRCRHCKHQWSFESITLGEWR